MGTLEGHDVQMAMEADARGDEWAADALRLSNELAEAERTAERIAAWLDGLKDAENMHVPLFDVETVAESFAERIRAGEWKR